VGWVGRQPRAKRAKRAKRADLPHVFHAELVMAVEVHEEAQGPEVMARVDVQAAAPADVESGVSHHRVVGPVQEFHAEFLEEEAHAQGGEALVREARHLRVVLPSFYLLLRARRSLNFVNVPRPYPTSSRPLKNYVARHCLA
jgi:hypothetical protein